MRRSRSSTFILQQCSARKSPITKTILSSVFFNRKISSLMSCSKDKRRHATRIARIQSCSCNAKNSFISHVVISINARDLRCERGGFSSLARFNAVNDAKQIESSGIERRRVRRCADPARFSFFIYSRGGAYNSLNNRPVPAGMLHRKYKIYSFISPESFGKLSAR